MNNIYDQIMVNAATGVTNASDRLLTEDGFNEKVFNSSKVQMPKLKLEQTKVQIKTEELTYPNIPPGISFSMSGNNVVEYAIYSIPLSGEMDLFVQLVKQYIDRRVTYMEYNTLFYKEYSNAKISGNETLIEAIKNRVIGFTTNVNNALSQFEQELNQFYDVKLKPAINELIKSEISKRSLRSSAESKLNPFA